MNKKYSSFPPIAIIAYSDYYNVPAPKVWGDYWLKKNLLNEFKRLGYPVDISKPKILLHLFGEPAKNIPSDTHNIIWIHSHPDWINRDVLRKYQKIYCISKHFTQKIISMGFDAELLMVPTNMKPLHIKKTHDIVFVGNTKKNKARRIISDIQDTQYNMKIWGWGWKGLIPDKWHGGEYYENRKLNELYASSKIVLNDHHEDMRREGFINPRVLDVLASRGFVVSDNVAGMDELLDNSVPSYTTPDELRSIIDKYINDDDSRNLLSKKGSEIALQYTYDISCAKIIRHIESIFDKLKP